MITDEIVFLQEVNYDEIMQSKRPACRQAGSAQLLLILLAAIVIAGAGLYFFRDKQEIQTFQIPKKVAVQKSVLNDYSNPNLGFQFNYPKDLTVETDSEEEFNRRGNGNFRKNFKGYVGYEPGQVIEAVVVLDQSNDFEKSPLSVWVFNNETDLTIEQWFDKYWYYPFVWGVFDYTSKGHIALDKETTVSGQPTKSKIITYQPGKPKFVYISKNQKMYLFRIIGETGDKILSTLKFIP